MFKCALFLHVHIILKQFSEFFTGTTGPPGQAGRDGLPGLPGEIIMIGEQKKAENGDIGEPGLTGMFHFLYKTKLNRLSLLEFD